MIARRARTPRVDVLPTVGRVLRTCRIPVGEFLQEWPIIDGGVLDMYEHIVFEPDEDHPLREVTDALADDIRAIRRKCALAQFDSVVRCCKVSGQWTVEAFRKQRKKQL